MTRQGMTLVEIVTASVLAALLVGGTMMAFVSATKGVHHSSGRGEATFLALQTLEGYRNQVACRQGAETQSQAWFNAACQADAPVGNNAEALPMDADLAKFPNASRQYQITPRDCDGDSIVGDCLQMTVKVHWDAPQ